MHRVKVRRERPAAAAWALAVLLTALFVFLIARGAGTQSGEETPESAPRRAYALTFAPLETHLVQFGAYEDALSARIEAARYMPRGAAGYVLEGSLYRVIGAGYDSRQDAQGVCERLREEEGMEASVYSLSSGEVELTIQGTQAQVEALTQAETALRNAAAQLNETAFGYDRGNSPVRTRATVSRSSPPACGRRTRRYRRPPRIRKIRPSTHFSPFYPIWPLKRSNFPMKMLPRVFPFPAESSIIISVCV